MTKKMVHSVDVDLPVRTVYNQWTQFEDFPLFMKHVDTVEQRGDDRLVWKARIAGVSRTWEARITEQLPDQRIAWQATEGIRNDGVVTFHHLGDHTTRVTLQLDVDPDGFLESVATKGGMVDDRAEKDLRQFKEFVEARGRETGGYRGTIEQEAAHRAVPRPVEFGGDDDGDLGDRHRDGGDRHDADLGDRHRDAGDDREVDLRDGAGAAGGARRADAGRPRDDLAHLPDPPADPDARSEAPDVVVDADGAPVGRIRR